MTLQAGGGGRKDCPLFDITHLQEKKETTHQQWKKVFISTPRTSQDLAQIHINMQKL